MLSELSFLSDPFKQKIYFRLASPYLSANHLSLLLHNNRPHCKLSTPVTKNQFFTEESIIVLTVMAAANVTMIVPATPIQCQVPWLQLSQQLAI